MTLSISRSDIFLKNIWPPRAATIRRVFDTVAQLTERERRRKEAVNKVANQKTKIKFTKKFVLFDDGFFIIISIVFFFEVRKFFGKFILFAIVILFWVFYFFLFFFWKKFSWTLMSGGGWRTPYLATASRADWDFSAGGKNNDAFRTRAQGHYFILGRNMGKFILGWNVGISPKKYRNIEERLRANFTRGFEKLLF